MITKICYATRILNRFLLSYFLYNKQENFANLIYNSFANLFTVRNLTLLLLLITIWSLLQITWNQKLFIE